MATTSVINTTALTVHKNTTGTTYVKYARATSASLNVTHSPREITSKDSQGWQEFLEGLRGGTMSVEGFYAYDDTLGGTDLFDVLEGRTKVKLRFMTAVAGDVYFEAFAYCTSFNPSSDGQEDNATYSAEFQITGAITKGTIS